MKKLISVMCTVLLVIFAAVPAFAAESPQATTFAYDVIIIPTPGGDADYEKVTEINDDGEQEVHLTSSPKDGYRFDHWEMDGPYKTTDKLTDGDIDVIITGDITVTPVFKAIGTSTQPATNATINIDNSSKSPQTGSNDVVPYTVVILSVIACGVMGAFVIKSSKSK